jgi:hypothetical protein
LPRDKSIEPTGAGAASPIDGSAATDGDVCGRIDLIAGMYEAM